VAATAILAVTATAAIKHFVRRPSEPVFAAVAFDIERAAARGSGTSVVGEPIAIRAVVDAPGELRVYDDAGAEQARCAVAGPDCRIDRVGSRTTLRLTMKIGGPGDLHAVLFSAPVAGSAGGIDVDVEAALKAGVEVATRDLSP
jgi:hypothetical protein